VIGLLCARVTPGELRNPAKKASQPFRFNETTDSGANLASHSNSKPQPARARNG
jgi:hypothetical protein